MEEYHNILDKLGFEKVLELPFYSEKWRQDDTLYVFWQEKNGILLRHDTWRNEINSAHFYYNWKPNYVNEGEWWCAISTGNFQIKDLTGQVSAKELYPDKKVTLDPERERLWNEKFKREAVWVGYNDARDRIETSILQLEKHGKFINPWEFRDRYISFLHYGDIRENYDAINTERINALPDHVRKAISPC